MSHVDWGHRVSAQPRDNGPATDGSHGDHDHHTPSPTADERYLRLALLLILGFMLVEVAVAFAFGSLALLADAGHMLTDAAAIAGAIVAARLAARPPTGSWTFGFKRAEILSAAANGITLLVIAAVIAVEAVRRLTNPPEVQGLAMLAVAILGIVVNAAASMTMARANRSSLNIEGAFQHILTDLYAFVATALAGTLIFTLGWRRADPAASLVVVALMLRASWSLLRDAGRVLLQAAPSEVDIEAVRLHMSELRYVQGVHDLHVWTVTSGLPVLSAHVVVDDECLSEGRTAQLLDRLQECLVGHFDVEHSTLQIEPVSHVSHEVGAHD